MTNEQYERWKDFSLRMVDVAVSSRKLNPSRATVRENIEFFFECRMDPYDEWQRVVDWDFTEPSEFQKSTWPHAAMSVSSHVSDLAQYFIPNYLALDTGRQFELAESRFVDPVHICIRAGLDVAVSPSAGVSGFSAGDIRKIFPEGVPDWVKSFFQSGELVALHPTNMAGIYSPEVVGFDSRTFDELPDHEPVWL